MDDLSTAFAKFADEFVSSAETEDHLRVLTLIALAAWNLADRTEEERTAAIQTLIDRFRCPTYVWRGTVTQTKDKILEMCRRKQEMYPDLHRQIASLDIEGLPDGLEYTAVEKGAPTSRA